MTKSIFTILFFAVVHIAGAQQVSWYRQYSGFIGKTPYTMHLHRMGEVYRGFYYYDRTQRPIYFTGTDTSKGQGAVALTTFIPGQSQTNEIISLNSLSKDLQGTWQKEDGSSKVLMTGSETDATNLRFDFVFKNEERRLRKNREVPAASFHASSVWPKGKSGTDIYLQKIISGLYGKKGSTQPIGQTFLKNRDDFFAAYIKDNRDVPDSELAEHAYGFNLDMSDDVLIAYRTEKILVLANLTYTYTGGAHGNYGTSYMVFDLVRNRQLKLADIFPSKFNRSLPGLLAKYFRKDMGLGEKEDLTEGGLFDNKIEPNDNFYITKTGLGFNYVPYEIASYAQGEVHIFIPFTEIETWLNPTFKSLLK